MDENVKTQLGDDLSSGEQQSRPGAGGSSDEQANFFADQLGSIPEAIRNVSESLKESNQAGIATYIDRFADRADSLVKSLRGKRPQEIYRQVEDLARNNPVIAFAGAVAVGVLLSRYSKSLISTAKDKSESYPETVTSGLVPQEFGEGKKVI